MTVSNFKDRKMVKQEGIKKKPKPNRTKSIKSGKMTHKNNVKSTYPKFFANAKNNAWNTNRSPTLLLLGAKHLRGPQEPVSCLSFT